MSDVALYAIGNFTVDDIVLWPSGRTWMGQPGGNALFSALGACVWLDSVGLLARLGNDYPRERLKDIEARGIRLFLHEVDAPTLHDWALYEAGGARQFVNHLNSGSNEAMTIHADEIPRQALDGRAYHIAPVPTDLQAGLVRRLKQPGRLISLDPHESWIVGHETVLIDLLGEVGFFLPSELEARRLYGSNAPEAAAREFGRRGPKAVVIKIGTEGSLVYDASSDSLTHVPIFSAEARDTTGAGDAYCGGFLAGYLLTGDAVTAAQYGTVAASFVVEAVGALSTRQPTREQALERLALVAERTRRGVRA